MRTALVASILTAFLIAGCFPGGGTQRKIAGEFRLERWEDGITYYLHKRGHDDSDEGGSVIGGTVVRIGWSSRHIVVQRYSIYRGDFDGWMIIDVQTDSISGPFSDAQVQARDDVRGIATYPVAEAWEKL
ncbi:MAG: hypothetical protein HYV96_03140 [Opitutae bacterium]|nr:hypothetical protein [Opitutae bacterium]